jgi:MFS family permease
VAAFVFRAQQAGFLLIPLVLSSSVGSVLSGRLLGAVGARPMLLGGFGLVAAGALVLGLWPAQFWLFLGASLLLGAGVGVVVGGVLRAIVLQEAPLAERGVAQGLINICTNVGNLLVLATMGAIADQAGNNVAGFSQAYLGVAMVMLVMVALAGAVRVRLEASEPQPVVDPWAAPSESL